MNSSNNNESDDKAPTAVSAAVGDLEEALLSQPSSPSPTPLSNTHTPPLSQPLYSNSYSHKQQYLEEDESISESLSTPATTTDHSLHLYSENVSSPLILSSDTESQQTIENEKNSNSFLSKALAAAAASPVDEATLAQVQDDHLLQVPTKKKGLHVGTLLDGWTPYDPKADKTSFYVRECLNGLAISFTQIPESIFFSKLAHVSPALGLRSSWIVGLICALIGGRPAMINGSSGAYAMMISTFVIPPLDSNGNGQDIEYLFPSVIFAGILNMIFSFLNIGDGLLTLLSTTIVIAFCNCLAIFMANPLFNYEFPVRKAFVIH